MAAHWSLFCLVLALLAFSAVESRGNGHHHSNPNIPDNKDLDQRDPADGSLLDQVNHIPEDINKIGDSVSQAENVIVTFFNSSKSTFEQALVNLSSYLPINVDYALNASMLCNPIDTNRGYYHTIALILAAALIMLGIIFAFVGYRLMKIVLFLIGFLSGGSVTYFIILAFTHQYSAEWVLYVSIIVPILVGIIAGILVILLYYIGIFLAGGSIGFLIIWFVLAAIDIAFFRDHIYVPIIIAVVVGIIVGFITLFVQKWFFIFGTTVLGSFMIVWGLDYYLELGSIIYYLVLFAEHRSQITPCWYSWVMVGLFGVLIIVAFLVQALVTGRKYDHRKEFKGICCGACRRKRTKQIDDGGKYVNLKEIGKGHFDE